MVPIRNRALGQAMERQFMTNDECLASPHHATYAGVCYVGSEFSIGLSSVNNPQPVTFHTDSVTGVPEPSTIVLFAVAIVAYLVHKALPRCRYP